MSQADIGNITAGQEGADFFDNKLEPWRNALHSSHSGTSRPSYAAAGTWWLNTTTSPWIYNIYDGSNDIGASEIDAIADTITWLADGVKAKTSSGVVVSNNSAAAVATFGASGGTDSTMAGFLGLGGVAPTTKLHLQGAKNTNQIYIESTTNNNSWVIDSDELGGIDIYSADAGGAGAGVKASMKVVAKSTNGANMDVVFGGATSTTNDVNRLRFDYAGNVVVNDGIGTLDTTATGGFLYIPSCAGTPTGVPAVTYTGIEPLVINTSAPSLFFRAGGAWHSLSKTESGTYTPTLTNTTNITSSTATQCQYMRVGNVVTVSGQVTIDPTATGAIELWMSLPIASDLANNQNVGGTAASFGGTATQVLPIGGKTVENVAYIGGLVTDSSSRLFSFSFTYLVI